MPSHLLRALHSPAVTLLALAVSLGLNLFQAVRIYSAVSAIGDSTQSPKRAFRKDLSQGEVLPPMEVKTLKGERYTLNFADSIRPTVVYVMSPSCMWCRANEHALAELVRGSGGRFSFVGLSLAVPHLEEYLRDHPVPFPVYTMPSGQTFEAYKLGSTPQTIVISPDGRVLRNWIGAYGGLNRLEIARYFGVQLPELSQSSLLR
ncbi:MAG TPA: TlpA disulfide reductase family protein [Terriglobia bacterium]|nr:TlpA disulfide reductase family protein [Terriglobia bacterium]